MTATLYSANDASAPALSTSVVGSLYDILKACLINGYGTRTAKGGWTVAYDDAANDTLVLKHVTENMYIRIDDGIDYRYGTIQAFTAMTDVNTGTGEWPTTNEVTNHPLKMPKRYSTTAVQNEWHLLVDDAGDWVYFWTYDVSYPSGFFFGKILDFDGITKHWLVTGMDVTSMSAASYHQALWSENGGHGHTQKDRWGELKPEGFEWIGQEESMEQPQPSTGKFVFGHEYIRTTDAPYCLKGKWPNRIKSWGVVPAYSFSIHQKVTINGTKYIAMKQGGTTFLMEYDSDSG